MTNRTEIDRLVYFQLRSLARKWEDKISTFKTAGRPAGRFVPAPQNRERYAEWS